MLLVANEGSRSLVFICSLKEEIVAALYKKHDVGDDRDIQ